MDIITPNGLKHFPIVKADVYHWQGWFKPRWKVLDAPKDSYLWGAHFWTRQGAEYARNKELT